MPKKGEAHGAPTAMWRRARDAAATKEVDQTFDTTVFGRPAPSPRPASMAYSSPISSRNSSRSNSPNGSKGRKSNVWDRLHRAKTESRRSSESPKPADESFFSLASTSKLSLSGLDGEFSCSAWTLPGCDDMAPEEKRVWVRALREAGHGYPHLKCSRSSIIQKPDAAFQEKFSPVTPRSRCLIDEAKSGGCDTGGVGSSDPIFDFEHHVHPPMFGCDMVRGAEEQRAWIREMYLSPSTFKDSLALRTARPRAPIAA